MNLLIDTHVALWALTGDSKLPRQARALIADPANTATVSAVSLWEISIKNALRRNGPNALPFSADQSLRLFEAAGFRILPVTAAHAVAVEGLDPLHGDPFDRLLVAQALTEPLRLVTHDVALTRYSDSDHSRLIVASPRFATFAPALPWCRSRGPRGGARFGFFEVMVRAS